MALCNTSCATTVPAFPSVGCEIEERSGGIPFLGLIQCDVEFTDVTDPAEWATKVTANEVHILSEGIGAKPETEKTTARRSSCRPEQFISETHVLTFQTYAVDNTAQTDFGIHNQVRNNAQNFRLFWIDCNNLFYLNPDVSAGVEGIGFEFSISKWEYIIPDNNDESAYYDIEVRFKHKGIVPGTDLPGVIQELS